MNHREQSIQSQMAMANQAAYVTPPPSNKDLVLTPEAEAMLAAERDAEVRKLRERADAIAARTPLEYLAVEGLHVRDTESLELTGRLVKAGWDRIVYSENKGAWQVGGNHGEWHVLRDEVMQMLGCK